VTARLKRARLKNVLLLAGVKNAKELRRVYDEEDQRLMKAGEWDYDNNTLLINKIRQALNEIDWRSLNQKQREICEEIRWFWHHHAISCAIWKKKDRIKAKHHAGLACGYQPDDHPNKITLLLWWLVSDQLEQAYRWAETITEEPEKSTAQSLIEEYKRREFF
jgi:hypothetical protein